MSLTAKRAVFWFVLLVLVMVLWQSTLTTDDGGQEMSYNRFRELVEDGAVARVALVERRVRGILGAGGEFRLDLPFEPDAGFVEGLMEDGVEVYGGRERESPVLALFLTWGPVLLIVGLWIFFMRQFRARAEGEQFRPLRDDRGPSEP